MSERGRLVISGQVSFQREGKGPEAVAPLRALRHSKGGGQPYRREFRVGEEWAPLDLGWFADQPAGLLLLANPGGPPPDRNPTPEEREAARSLVVEVALAAPGPYADPKVRTMWSPPAPAAEPFAVLRPKGVPLLLEPRGLGRYRLRCPAGEAEVVLYLYPA